jgi:hypothetical protein
LFPRARSYYRQVKIAGKEVVEESVLEPSLEAIPGYDEETRIQDAAVSRRTLASRCVYGW